MNVDYVDHMGNDLMVVNAARVSFQKESTLEWSHTQGEAPYRVLREGDVKLIKYLADHNHWTPFGHPQITLRVKAPIFVRTQLFKHKVGFTENEVSRRYVDDTPEFYRPERWRGRPTGSAKQGSSGEVGTKFSHLMYDNSIAQCLDAYQCMLDEGVAPEQARMVLPQSMYTEWYWTGSLAAYARMCKLRLDPHAQAETREVAQMISDIIAPLFPVSWSVLIGE